MQHKIYTQKNDIMITTDQLKAVEERSGALRRYL